MSKALTAEELVVTSTTINTEAEPAARARSARPAGKPVVIVLETGLVGR